MTGGVGAWPPGSCMRITFSGEIQLNSGGIWCENARTRLCEYICASKLKCLLGDYIVKVIALSADGGFSEWSSWGSCSKSCGQGVQERFRTCDSPPPGLGGDNCTVGAWSDSRSCSERPCPGKNSHLLTLVTISDISLFCQSMEVSLSGAHGPVVLKLVGRVCKDGIEDVTHLGLHLEAEIAKAMLMKLDHVWKRLAQVTSFLNENTLINEGV